jgi:3D (Asp-Asp-Asp) domain-containing protein
MAKWFVLLIFALHLSVLAQEELSSEPSPRQELPAVGEVFSQFCSNICLLTLDSDDLATYVAITSQPVTIEVLMDFRLGDPILPTVVPSPEDPSSAPAATDAATSVSATSPAASPDTASPESTDTSSKATVVPAETRVPSQIAGPVFLDDTPTALPASSPVQTISTVAQTTEPVSPLTEPSAVGQKVRVRLTFYSPQEDGWGSQVAWPNVRCAMPGRTAAADPSLFPFGTWIEIPGFGRRRIEDTGTAVKARTASGGTDPVIDLYVDNWKELRRLSKSAPDYLDILIIR